MTTMSITWTPEHGGGTIKGETAREIVRALWRTARLREATPRAYMQGVARRAEIMTGAHVRTSSSEAFLRDLESAGIITINREGE